jgi:hypothetical protein
LLAASFAIAHQYDAAAHANGQTCATCVAATSFGVGNVAVSVLLAVAVATASVVVSVGIVFRCVLPGRRYARGPPRVSFTS